jgi:hypothetical protein
MPTIFQYKCENYSQCKFIIIDTGSTMHVKLDDGVTKVLSHPSEEARALALTGKSIFELNREGRIYYKKSKICFTCYKIADDCACQDKTAYKLVSELEETKCPVCKTEMIKKSVVGMS